MASKVAQAATIYEQIGGAIEALNLRLRPDELAELAVQYDLGESELEAVNVVFSHIVDKNREAAIAMMLKLSRLPQKVPKTFDSFDFGRIQGRDAATLKKLPALANLYAHKNVAFIGPHGVGKTHLAQAYGRECCMQGYKTYFLKASELKEKLSKAAMGNNPSKTVASLVKPSCLIIDEVGRCVFDEASTNLFFDIVDRRYEKEGPNALILTSNMPAVNWKTVFTGSDTLLCMLDRIFDKATVYIMKGSSYRGAELETCSVESVPQAKKVRF